MTLREIAQGYRIAEANLREQEHRILLQPESEESHRLNTVRKIRAEMRLLARTCERYYLRGANCHDAAKPKVGPSGDPGSHGGLAGARLGGQRHSDAAAEAESEKGHRPGADRATADHAVDALLRELFPN